ncbi:g392 [Coccomyxa viridis]|uniref:G392 protein n=1 Tax=Coccomyxa viridis TaxID=1274662 RepID=A0ABP1FHK7_9CHLO
MAFLSSVSGADAVFLALVDRARAEPLRYPASAEALKQMDILCSQITTAVRPPQPLSGTLRRSVSYLQTLVGRKAAALNVQLLRVDGTYGDKAFQGGHTLSLRSAKAAPDRELLAPEGDETEDASELAAIFSSAQAAEDEADVGVAICPDLLTARWGGQAPSTVVGQGPCGAFLPCLSWATEPASGRKRPYDHDKAMAREAAELQEQLTAIASAENTQSQPTEPEEATPASESTRRAGQNHRLSSAPPSIDSLQEKDIEAILGIVCSNTSMPSIWGDVGKSQNVGADSASNGSSTQDEEACCSVLAHLLVDMWQRAGPATSFSLACILLKRLLSSARVDTQARAFDILLNLAACISSSMSKGQPAVDNIAALQEWTRLLLFELLHTISQKQGVDEKLWAAALGCLCQLCMQQGALIQQHTKALSPRAAVGLLHACTRYHWSDALHTTLVCLATSTLYDEGAQKIDLSAPPSAVRASTGSLREQDDSNGEAQIGGFDQDDDAASFRTAEGNSDEAAALGDQAESVHGELNPEKLEAYGGAQEVARQLARACSSQARRNLLCILLDCVLEQAAADNGAEQEEEEITNGDELSAPSVAALREACRCIAGSSAADALGVAFHCGMPGFAMPLAAAVWEQSGRADEEAEDSEELQQALLVLLARLEALAVSAAAGELMPALTPALAQSLADVSGADAAPEDSAAVWECLSDLLCSPDANAAQLAESWLLRLLMAAAQRQLGDTDDEAPKGGAATSTVALLPSLPEDSTQSTPDPVDIGFRDQPHLALLLQHALSQARAGANTAVRLVAVVRRLLALVKLRCALPQHAWSMELHHAPVSPPYLRSLRGPGRSICTPRVSSSGKRHSRMSSSLDGTMRRLRLSDDASLSPSSADLEPGLPRRPLTDRPSSRLASTSQELKGHQLSMLAMDEEGSLDADSAEGTTEHRHSASNSQSRAGLSEAEEQPGSAIRRLPSGMRLDLSRARRSSSEGMEAGSFPEDSLWLEQDAAGITLATLHLLSQWLLQAPQACRQEAFQELGQDLMRALTSPLPSVQQKVRATQNAGALQSSGPVTAFLEAQTGCPFPLLSKVPASLLARTLEELQHVPDQASGLSSLQDLRLSVFLLLVSRIVKDRSALKSIGGPGVFVQMLEDGNARMRHIAAAFLQGHYSVSQRQGFCQGVRHLVLQAQQSPGDKRLRTKYLQVTTLLNLRFVDPAR